MSDEPPADLPTPGQDVDGLQQRLETAVALAEDGNRKANSEAAFAYNAKQMAEEHATAISKIKGEVESQQSWLVQAKSDITTAAEASAAAAKNAESQSRAAADEAGRARTAAERAEAAQSSVETAKTETTASVAKAAEELATLAKARADGESWRADLEMWHMIGSELVPKLKDDAATIANLQIETKGLADRMRVTTERSETVEAKVTEYEAKIASYHEEIAAHKTTIESLLPGATSAGLASAFLDQQQRFEWPIKFWLWGFLVAVCGLIVFGLVDAWGILSQQDVPWDALGRHAVRRVFVAGPLIWLGWFSGKRYTMALRLQEDYAYKQAISTAFEGYRTQMEKVGTPAEGTAPLLQLCAGVLKTLSQRPGRLYDGKQDDVMPSAEVVKAVGGLLPLGKGE